MARSRRGPATTPVTDALEALIASGALKADALQRDAAAVLDRLATELSARDTPRGLLAGLFGGPEPVRGAYLVGQVGRGKTMLMDMFFAHAGIAQKRRAFRP